MSFVLSSWYCFPLLWKNGNNQKKSTATSHHQPHLPISPDLFLPTVTILLLLQTTVHAPSPPPMHLVTSPYTHSGTSPQKFSFLSPATSMFPSFLGQPHQPRNVLIIFFYIKRTKPSWPHSPLLLLLHAFMREFLNMFILIVSNSSLPASLEATLIRFLLPPLHPNYHD